MIRCLMQRTGSPFTTTFLSSLSFEREKSNISLRTFPKKIISRPNPKKKKEQRRKNSRRYLGARNSRERERREERGEERGARNTHYVFFTREGPKGCASTDSSDSRNRESFEGVAHLSWRGRDTAFRVFARGDLSVLVVHEFVSERR